MKHLVKWKRSELVFYEKVVLLKNVQENIVDDLDRFAFIHKSYYTEVVSYMTKIVNTRGPHEYREENIYEMAETLLEKQECVRLVTFVKNYEWSTDSAERIKEMFNLEVSDATHEKMILSVVKFEYVPAVFLVRTYVS